MAKKETKKNKKELIKENKNQKNDEMKNKKLSNGSKIVFSLLLIIVFVLSSIYFAYKGISTVTIHRFSYKEKSYLDYETCLKENNYFNEKCLGKDKQYIASIINTVNSTFKYDFEASNKFDYKYSYDITARMISTEKGNQNKVLYDKSETLLDKKTFQKKNSKNFSIKENVEIDYDKYNRLMTSFRKDYTLTLDSNLIVTLNVSIDGNYENIDDNITASQNIILTIPLSEQTMAISMDYKDINDFESIQSKKKNEMVNKVFYGLSALTVVLSVINLVNLYTFVKKDNKSKSNYTKKLGKIMREYNQIIVETKKVPDFDNIKRFEIDSFEELLDVRETIIKPILYVEISRQESYFIIINGNELYCYILKDDDLA